MPTYEFRCPAGHDFEKFYRTISGAESAPVCPVCGKVAERKMSATGFAFKGSGFYLTDYGKNAHRGDGETVGKATDTSKKDSPGGTAGDSSGATDTGSSTASPEASKTADTASSTSEPKKAEPKAEPKVEAKPAPAAPKPSAGE